MNIESIDLNLFPVFRAIYATRSVTSAGDRLGLTQSAVSNALRRLRERFNDPLFVRCSAGMQPTPAAEQLIECIEAGLRSFDQAVKRMLKFDPPTSSRQFRVAINDVSDMVSVPRLFAALHRAGPRLVLQTVNTTSAHHAKRLLQDGDVDVALAGWAPLGEGFGHAALFDEGIAVVARRDDRFGADTLTLEDYVSASHAEHRSSDFTAELVQHSLARLGVDAGRKVVLSNSHLLGIAKIVGMTELLLTLPARLAQALVEGQDTLRQLQAPFEVETFPIRLHWHDRSDCDEGHRWFRGLVASALKMPGLQPQSRAGPHGPTSR